MVTRAYILALALLLGFSTQANAGRLQEIKAQACTRASGKTMFHARLGAEFKVASVDLEHGLARGSFPGTPHGDALIYVQCLDLFPVLKK